MDKQQQKNTRNALDFYRNYKSLMLDEELYKIINVKNESNNIVAIPKKVPKTNELIQNQSSQQSQKNLQGKSKIPFSSGVVVKKETTNKIKPTFHEKWSLFRVVSGHTGWVRSIAVDHSNKWFATGSADRMIKIWDMASGKLKITLTGHISVVRGVAISDRHPYIFSCGEDKTVKCWDLEQNKVVRSYHGHMSGVYCIAIHPELDYIVSGGRDSVARLWDIRTKASVHTLTGHTSSVMSVLMQRAEPQVITGSHDRTIRFYDIVSGRSTATLTNHKKGVRAMVLHPRLYCMTSAGADNIKKWHFPEGTFMQNMEGGHGSEDGGAGTSSVVNALAMNEDGVLVSGGDDGRLCFYDWKSGSRFDSFYGKVQPGSLESECGVFAMAFDLSGGRLITCEADKTIKFYKEAAV